MKDEHNALHRDSPLLTAYSLGELRGEELARVEAALQADPSLRERVAELRALEGDLEAALSLESFREEREMAEASVDPYPRRKHKTLLEFPSLYFIIGGVSAACFAVLVVSHSPVSESVLRPGKGPLVRVEVPVVSAPAPEGRAPLSEVASEPAMSLQTGSPEVAESQADLPTLRLPASIQKEAPESARPVSSGDLATSDKGKAPAVAASMVAEAGLLTSVVMSGEAVVTTGSVELAVPPDLSSASYGVGGGRSLGVFGVEEASQDRPFVATFLRPTSSLGLETGTASYGRLRAALAAGLRPQSEDLRIEEMLNAMAFTYDGENARMEKRQSAPSGPKPSLVADVELAPAPWAPAHSLLRVGVQAEKRAPASRAPESFLVLADLEGGLGSEVVSAEFREALRGFAARLKPDDQLRLVSLRSGRLQAGRLFRASEKWELLSAIDRLGVEELLELQALQGLLSQTSRVLVCTDGRRRLPAVLESSRLPLSVLAWGGQPEPSEALVRLSGRSRFRIDWADTAGRARAALLEQAGEGDQVVARSARLDLRFNPSTVAAYRLIGYEGRQGAREESLPGDLVSGQAFTALYELVPAGQPVPEYSPDRGLSFQQVPTGRARSEPEPGERSLVDIQLEYLGAVDGRRVRRLYHVLEGRGDWENASEEFRFAAAVAGFGMVLRDSPFKGQVTLAQLEGWSRLSTPGPLARDAAEFVRVVQQARSLGYR